MAASARRTATWAIAGFIIAVCWGIYFTFANKVNPIGLPVYALASVTQPIAAAVAYFHIPFGLRAAAVMNAATYALLGLILEAVRKQRNPAQQR